MSAFTFLGITLGLLGGAALGYSLIKIIYSKVSKQSASPSFIVACSKVGALLMLLPAFFISFTVGGNFGGSFGSALGLGLFGIPLGLAVGISIFLGFGLAFGACVGGLFGKGFLYVFRSQP